jgi:DNA mismatch endonuclease, patch repair protein
LTDIMTAAQRSRLMSRIRSKGTTPERYMHELAEAAGLAFTRHNAEIAGKPDLAFASARLAVFVDGDFWHGWRLPIWKHRLSPFWLDKISRNRARDARNFRRLRRRGWRVLRIWEHEIEQDPIRCVVRVADAAAQAIDRAALQARYSAMPPLKRRKRLPKP